MNVPRSKVLVPDAHLPDLDMERDVTGDAVEYVVYDALDAAEIPEQAWHDCDAVLIWHRMRLTRDVVGKLEKCRFIVRVGVGFDNVDVDACARRGIPVANVPNYGTTEVADHALALMLSLLRGLDSYQARLRADLVGGFVAEDVPVVRRIRGGVFGAIGMGRIGTAVARRARAFDMQPVYYDPFLPEGHELGLGFRRVNSLPELLAAADVVGLHVPLNASTRGMMGAAQFEHMKPGSILINVARGGLVDLSALEAALRSGRLAAAGLDVLPTEPPGAEPPALLRAWQADEAWLRGRLIVTPHAAFYSEAGYRDMRRLSAEILRDFLAGIRVRNVVNPDWALHAARLSGHAA
jgi:lactate dehydrogenase-like 2-hydroxyacid dehydrogenase